MNLTELETHIRENYNAVGETFWSQAEILRLIFRACSELAIETNCIEATYSTTSAAGTAEYAFPSNTHAIKRVTYNGAKLQPISQREADAFTLNTASAPQGTPNFYSQWNETITLYPTPSTSALTIKVWSVNLPQELTSVSASLEVPTWTHPYLPNFALAKMCAKDGNLQGAAYYAQLWAEDKMRVKVAMARKKRRDSFAQVLDEDALPVSILGVI